MTILTNIPLAPLTSFKTGGCARYFLEPATVGQIAEGLSWAGQNGRAVFLLGRGTNLVFSDAGFDGLVIHLHKPFSKTVWQGNGVRAQSGLKLHNLVMDSVARGLSGLQCMAGIPGTLGGAAYINAGAFGQELEQTVVEVVSCGYDGQIITRAKEQCRFGYRHSLFCGKEEVILEVALSMTPGNKPALQKEMRGILARRKEKQPLEFPNAGSMFKRPAGGYAGAMIEAARLKGLSVGGASVSEKHANFIINRGNASAQDIYDLSQTVICRVREQSGIMLEREVKFIGEFLPWPRNSGRG
jgi:UDP-N-acetylmuramate dehydrogenase